MRLVGTEVQRRRARTKMNTVDAHGERSGLFVRAITRQVSRVL